MKLSRLRAKILSNKCHVSVQTLPIFNWWQFHETRDLSWLFIKRRKVGRFEKRPLEILWTNIFNEYIEKYGFGDVYQEIMQIQKNVIALRMEAICNEDTSRLTFIDIEELKLEELKEKLLGKKNYFESNVEIQKIIGSPIDIYSCSVAQYKAYEMYVEEQILKARVA